MSPYQEICLYTKGHLISWLRDVSKLGDSLHIRDFPVLLIIILLNSLQLRLVQVGTLLYIVNHQSYKCCNNLNIYKKNELESTFIEIINPKKSNIIVGVIFRYPSMDLTNLNCNYLNKLLENISKEQKSFFPTWSF